MSSNFRILLSLITSVSLVSCAQPTPSTESIQTAIAQTQVTIPTPTITSSKEPKISDFFKNQITKFITEAGKLVSLTESGLNYNEYRQQFSSVKSTYEILDASWPDDFASEERNKFSEAIKVWDLALEVWNVKANYNKAEIEADSPLNGLYKSVLFYAGDSLKLYPNAAKPGTKYFYSEDAVPILFNVASKLFKDAQSEIIKNFLVFID